MKPWVSILTPVYNGIEFLEQCGAFGISVFTQKIDGSDFRVALHVRLPGHEENFQRLGAGTEDGGEKDNAVEIKQFHLALEYCLLG